MIDKTSSGRVKLPVLQTENEIIYHFFGVVQIEI